MKTLLITLLALLAASVAQAQTHSFTLTWDPATVAADKSNAPTGIKIERRTTTGLYAQVQSLGVVTTAQDSLPNPAPGNFQYCYRIRWFNTVGNGPYATEACGFTAPVVVPTVPGPVSGFTLSAISSSTIRMSWNADPVNPTEIWGRPSKGNQKFAYLVGMIPDTATWDWTGLKRYSTFCAEIRAVGAAVNGPFSAPTCATTSK